MHKHRPICMQRVNPFVKKWCNVFVHHRQRFGKAVDRHDIEQLDGRLIFNAQFAARRQHMRQPYATKMALVAAAVMQARDDFLAWVTTLVQRGGAQRLQSKRCRQQLAEQGIRQPGPAGAKLRQPPIAIATACNDQTVRTATERDGVCLLHERVRCHRIASAKQERRLRHDANLCAQYETLHLGGEVSRIAAAQEQAEALLIQSQQMEQRSHATLRIEPGAELPVAIGKRVEIAAELGLREGERIGPFDGDELGGIGAVHLQENG